MRLFHLIPLICSIIAPLWGNYSEIERNIRLKEITTADFAKIPPADIRWLHEQAIPKKEFQKRIIKLKVAPCLKKLKSIAKYILKPNVEGSSQRFRAKNTHSAPFDATRTLRFVPNFYISASDVLTPTQSYIVGEEPRRSTTRAFWQTLLYTGVKTVIALSTPINYAKDARYPLSVDDWTITKRATEEVAKSAFLDQKVVKHTFVAKNHYEKRTISIIHFENWPDHGTAEGTLFDYFLTYIEYINPDGGCPIFVHCAAGIGRSGTFVAAHSLCKEILLSKNNKNFTINLPQRIIEMRMQRKGMLSREVQVTEVIDILRARVL
jgi:protein tyrosine phosphatase